MPGIKIKDADLEPESETEQDDTKQVENLTSETELENNMDTNTGSEF